MGPNQTDKLLLSKGNHGKTKRQLTKWEKIVPHDSTDKGLIFRIYKQLMQLNSKKSQQPNGKMGKRPEQTFLQRRYTHGLKHMKKCSASPIIRDMQIKTTMRYHLTNKSTNNKCWRGCGEKGTFCTAGGNVNWYNHNGKQYGG